VARQAVHRRRSEQSFTWNRRRRKQWTRSRRSWARRVWSMHQSKRAKQDQRWQATFWVVSTRQRHQSLARSMSAMAG
jgi:hypothetical protein